MEGEADEAVRLGAPDEHLGDCERKVRWKPQIEAERMRGEIRKLEPGEKRPVVEDARIAEKRPVQAAGEPRDQAHADHVRESPDGACDHRPPQKKRYPEGYLLPQTGCGQPRQEPGRYFEGRFVPSTVAPQRQPYSVTVPALVPTARVPADASGASVTSFASMLVLPKPCVVTVTRPFWLVTMVATYFVPPTPAVVISQPHPLATAETLVPLW